jgi:hypothetical protein
MYALRHQERGSEVIAVIAVGQNDVSGIKARHQFAKQPCSPVCLPRQGHNAHSSTAPVDKEITAISIASGKPTPGFAIGLR